MTVGPPTSGSPSPTCVVGATEPTDDPAVRTGTGTYWFSLTQPLPQAGGTQYQTADLVFALTVDGDHVEGTLDGPTDQQLTQPSCPSNTVTPGKTTAELEGTLTDDALELQVVDAAWERPVVEPCPAGGLPGLIGETEASGIVFFEESLGRLERDADGVYRYDHVQTIAVGNAPFTVEYEIAVTFEE